MQLQIIVVIILVYLISLKSYIWFLPTIPVYPSSVKESNQVLFATSTITYEEKELFYRTNKSVSTAFVPYVNESEYQLTDMYIHYNSILYFFKYSINRPRPEQVNPLIKPLDTSSAQTPAYPAGHAMQAQLLANKLTKRYPEKKELFQKIALQCDICRVKAGLHYYSDGEFARALADSIS